VVEAFGHVDLVLHCADLTTTAVLDRLGEIGPVVAVRSAADPPRLFDGRGSSTGRESASA
jgi:hypothetical protein